jgi:hypothetical protein
MEMGKRTEELLRDAAVWDDGYKRRPHDTELKKDREECGRSYEWWQMRRRGSDAREMVEAEAKGDAA